MCLLNNEIEKLSLISVIFMTYKMTFSGRNEVLILPAI